MKVICESEQLNEQQAQELYQIMWIYCHGIATMIATKTVKFDETTIITMLDIVGRGVIGEVKCN